MDYSCTIKSRPFLYREMLKAGRLLLEGHLEEHIRQMALKENLFQLNTAARKKDIAAIVLKRLRVLDPYLLDRLANGPAETAKQLVIYTIMKTDRLFYEYMREVYQDKAILQTPFITNSDFRVYFQNKAEQSATVASWGDYTYYKLQQVYTRILLEAGLIKKDKDKLAIVRPIIDRDVAEHLSKIGDKQYVEILRGVY